MTDPREHSTNPSERFVRPALTLEECIEDALGVIADFDRVRPSEMNSFFYMNGFNQLDSVLRELLRALGTNPDM